MRTAALVLLAVALASVPVLAADEAQGSPQDAFVGRWSNADEKTSGLTRIEVVRKNDAWTIQAWGAGGGGTMELDQGKTTLSPVGDTAADKAPKYGFATWDYKFMTTHLTMRAEKDELVVETWNLFKDDSGRTSYRTAYRFKHAK